MIIEIDTLIMDELIDAKTLPAVQGHTDRETVIAPFI